MKELIHNIFEGKKDLTQADSVKAIQSVIEDLDQGRIRVVEKTTSGWRVNSWVKEAILLYFRTQKMTKMESGVLKFLDKIPLKQFELEDQVRVVPHAVVRRGAFVQKGVVLMPSYINIGAYVDEGSLIDTWATVGSCAQIGKNVHLSGGVGIGGVLEPLQASPVIIEDNAFIGSRSIIVEGVLVEEGAVIGAGVILTGSTKIIDVTGSQEKIYRGRVPTNSVVIPGTQTKKFPSGDYQTPCALIIGQRKESTDKKTSLNSALREFDVSV